MSEARNFLDENQEALKILAKKMVELQSIQTIDKEKSAEDLKAELIGRDMALTIISEWLNELFEIKNGEIMNLASEQDDMINRHEQVES